MADKYRLGMLLFLASEAVFFTVLILAFVFYRGSPANAGGPSVFNALDVGRVAIFTACLYASSFTIIMSERSHKKGKDGGMKLWLLLTIGLGAAFLFGEATEYIDLTSRLGVTPNRDIFGTTFYALTGFHGFHVLIGLLLLTIMFILVMGGKFRGGAHPSAYNTVALYWHFVDVVWVVIFPTVYLWSLAGPVH
ncbi:MAG: cytochrome c oxidase subunit 3 [Chloroflexota bacterium]|jgi:heme/copper-type cytochrome/quinol oxidase subunit 3|nr:cytochrome c oxidase subunit 3 [Chloroflexota bacterium]